jgi:hypothetical protein
MNFTIHTVKGSKPTKKDPNAPKITAKEALVEFLNSHLVVGTRSTVVAIIPFGFGGYQVVLHE